ncbi:uncharacterized protein BX663DRAFT_431125 [Cokeromyces recurvatus]|uniref:uncharacterized protein n=1 Tax=Cokeromyces recurvatus TaxID=90255 RepID=UPI002220023E|nr:uncharacterized protein BX663DRAFT_431125 [Cokeromyces recurvatus]KAI7904895.1 hypothetical protein BX663DRAFT_431125 [Cokeromyces recurvatus]
MNNFDFSNQRLDNAFRILCSKLYMKAESQQLDRIIQAFSKRYFECNKNTLLLSLDIVYAVAYSLLLLNTDLHVVGGGRATKMSKSSFVKNTMETIQSLILPEIEQCEECLSTISYYQHKDSSPLSQVNNSPSSMSHIVFNEKNLPRDNSISQRVEDNDMLQRRYALSSKLSEYDNLITCTQEVWLTEIEGLLKEMYAAVKAHRIDQAVTSNKPKTDNEGPRSIQRSKTLPKNICKETQGSLHMKRKRGYSFIQPFESSNHSITNFFLTDNDLASLFTTLKKEELYRQGLVMRKHLMKSTNKRANHRQWQLCYLVMTDSELIMYKPAIQQRTIKDYIKGKSRLLWNYYSSNSLFSLQDIIQHYPYWQANKDAPWMDILQMNHTYTTAIPPPGWNPQRPHVFRLETNEGGVWLFESTDQFAVQAWVEVCNLTAAKISKGPLLGAICNVNYGWKDINDYCNTGQQELVRIWYPPMPCMINSFLNIDEQYDDIKTQIEQLRKELDEHRKLKLLVDKKVTYK